MSRTRSGRALTALVAASALVAVGATPAAAHYKVDSKRWWFRGYTAAESNGTVPLDPINIFFYRGGRITGDRVDNHIAAHAGLKKLDDCKGGSQYLTFVNYERDRRQGAPEKNIDEVDRPRRTSCKPGDRYHLRFWDDLEHDDGVREDAHRVKDWGPANIHRDAVPKGEGTDRLNQDFDVSEKWLREKMKAHCQKRNWRVMPGAKDLPRTSPTRDRKARTNNGLMSLITMAHRSAPGQCPGSSG